MAHRVMKTAALLLVLAAPAFAADVLGDVSTTSGFLADLSQLAPTHAYRLKVVNLGELKAHDLRRLETEVNGYVARHRVKLEVPADGGVSAAELAARWGSDFDDAYLEEVVERCEALLRPLETGLRAAHEAGDVEREAMLRFSLHLLEDTMNDARRARGEYVPLTQPRDYP
jgi:hypothetical protein